jgi:hypothetical protein
MSSTPPPTPTRSLATPACDSTPRPPAPVNEFAGNTGDVVRNVVLHRAPRRHGRGRKSQTGETARAAADALLDLAENQTVDGLGPVLRLDQACAPPQ